MSVAGLEANAVWGKGRWSAHSPSLNCGASNQVFPEGFSESAAPEDTLALEPGESPFRNPQPSGAAGAVAVGGDCLSDSLQQGVPLTEAFGLGGFCFTALVTPAAHGAVAL